MSCVYRCTILQAMCSSQTNICQKHVHTLLYLTHISRALTVGQKRPKACILGEAKGGHETERQFTECGDVNTFVATAGISWLLALCEVSRKVFYCKFCSLQDGNNDSMEMPCLIVSFNPLKAELNPICYLLALLGAHHFLHVSRIRVKSLTLRLLMSYIYGAPILDVSRTYTTTHHSR